MLDFIANLQVGPLLIIYLIAAATMTFVSVKAADYVDLIDKKTNLSGAFIGGIMLSAITSLPELFTSLSSTILQGEPQLCLGNILGSDLFNITILATLVILYARKFGKANVAHGHLIVVLCTIGSYLAITMSWLGIVPRWSVSLTSVMLILFYALSVKYLAGEDGGSNDEEDTSKLTLKQVVFRLILAAVGIIAFSIVVSYMTEHVADRLNIGHGLAGALFMGVATSLPELSSTVQLFRKKNYDIAVGNIVGSNVFNFIILSITDIVSVNASVYDFSDPKNVLLLLFGILSALLFLVILKTKKTSVKVIGSVIVVLSYLAFLLIPSGVVSGWTNIDLITLW